MVRRKVTGQAIKSGCVLKLSNRTTKLAVEEVQLIVYIITGVPDANLTVVNGGLISAWERSASECPKALKKQPDDRKREPTEGQGRPR
jgi:hypothetical protein